MSLLSADDHLLLRATFGAAAEAPHHWSRWLALHPLDEVNAEAYDLLPRLYHALNEAGGTAPEMPRLKGIYRRTWYTNQLHLSQLRALLQPLSDRVGGIGLSGRHRLLLTTPESTGLVAPETIDLWVHPEEVLAVVRQAEQLGYSPARRLYDASAAHFVRYHHMLWLHGPAGQKLLLRWQMAPHSPYDVLGAQARAASLQGIPLLLLAPAHALLDLALPRPDMSLLQRVGDALFVCTSETVEWDEVARAAGALRLGEALHALLEAMQAAVPGVVPDTFLKTIKEMKGQSEHATYFEAEGVREKSGFLWAAYRRACLAGGPGRPSPAGFVRYCQARWRLRSPWAILPFVAREVRGRRENSL